MAKTTNSQECFHSASATENQHDNPDHTMKNKMKKSTCCSCMTANNLLLTTTCTRRSRTNKQALTHHSLPQQIHQLSTANYSRIQQEEPSWSNAVTKQKAKKEVRISQQIALDFTISHHDMSSNEKSCVWYSEQEYQKINRSCLKQIQKLDQGEILKDRKYCARGLENKTYITSIAQQMQRNLAYKVVFEEQERQRRDGVREPENIASLYYSVSASSQLWANATALTDQRLANAIDNDDDNNNYPTRVENNDYKSSSCRNIDRRGVLFPPRCDHQENPILIENTSNSSTSPLPSGIPHVIEFARAA